MTACRRHQASQLPLKDAKPQPAATSAALLLAESQAPCRYPCAGTCFRLLNCSTRRHEKQCKGKQPC